MAQLRDGKGRFAPQGKGRSRRARTRFKVLGATLTYTEAGIYGEQVTHAFTEAIRRSTNLTPAWYAWQPLWLEQNERIFEEEGPGWQELDEEYAKRKAHEVGDKPILQYTGRLMESFTDIDSPDMIFEPHPRTLQIGTAVPYSDVHQFGWHNIPARPHDVLEFETFDELVLTVGAYIEQPLEEVLR